MSWAAGLGWRGFLIAVAVLVSDALAQPADTTAHKLSALQTEIEAIRHARFKHPVKAAHQTLDAFSRYIEKELDRQFPPARRRHYGKVIRKVGLYRGPEIADFAATFKAVYLSQAAAYYDPATKTFYVVMAGLPEQMLVTVYAHELYHGFQDQFYGLTGYLDPSLSDDALLARQAVVEGEAHYVSSILTMRRLFPSANTSQMLRTVVQTQAGMDVAQLIQTMKGVSAALPLSSEMKQAMTALDTIPRFIAETMIGSYLKGMAFVFAVQQHGWDRLAELYTNPPVSTEQVLHPEKWFNHERPKQIRWPDFEREPVFQEWEVLETNTIGEMQWRVIFTEHGLNEQANPAAAGWNGDGFAVLERRGTGQLLLLLYTGWDSPAEAEEFRAAYSALLKTKYPDGNETVEIQMRGPDVLIVEGGAPAQTAAFMAFLERAGSAR